MGAIFGMVSCRDIKLDKIQHKMQEALTFRHKNDFDCHSKNDALLAAGGWSEDDFALIEFQGCTVVVEGEIYNSKEICQRFFLAEQNLWQQEKLTVIPLLYEKFGLDFPNYLNGVFAIALWDNNKKLLHLCRDHVGSHSLYYSITPEGVFFSTTVNSLLATGLVSNKLSKAAVNQYFASKALSPPATMYSAISSVRAAHVISITNGNITEHDYWKVQNIDVDDSMSEGEYVEQLRTIILDAINIRANYSPSYGVIVSGGLDTGIVASTLARKKEHDILHAFSVAFYESSFSDDPLQKLMVKEISLQHHQAILGASEFRDLLSDSVGYLDAPVNDIAFVGMAKTFELAQKQGFGVVFEGEGPDEIFPAGNTHGERQLAKFLLIPAVIRHKFFGTFFHTMPLGDSFANKVARMLTRIAMDDDERCLTWRTYFHNILRKQLLSEDWYDGADPYLHQRPYFAECKNSDSINRYQFGLIKTFLTDNLLFKDERMAASQGVVNRVPLIDYRIVELALKIPSRMQLTKPDEYRDGIKLLYKKALQGQIPQTIIEHKKVRGFSLPTSEWFRNELKDYVMDILLGDTTRKRGIVKREYVKKLVSQHLGGVANYDYPLNSLLVFELWMRKNYDTLSVAND